jgi:predicted nucleotidyltransferase
MFRIEQYKAGLAQRSEGHKVVGKLYGFGSALSPEFDEALSDMDVLV